MTAARSWQRIWRLPSLSCGGGQLLVTVDALSCMVWNVGKGELGMGTSARALPPHLGWPNQLRSQPVEWLCVTLGHYLQLVPVCTRGNKCMAGRVLGFQVFRTGVGPLAAELWTSWSALDCKITETTDQR